ncbi:endonuclease/exonuclease/phosphatase family protein [bacterium]|nr:endonuclease/exonuclease/phosphatase family protein [bacterium]
MISRRLALGLFCLAISAMLCSCKKAERQSPKDEGLPVKVMSFNIRYMQAPDGENNWRHRKVRVFQLIKEYQPDVIGLQEATHRQLKQILQELSDYDQVGVGRNDGVESGEYAAILYKKQKFQAANGGTFWFSDTPEQPGSTSWGNMIPRICTWVRLREAATGEMFYVYNVHLDHESQVSRERSALYLTHRISQRQYPDPVIVTGDFNAGETNIVIRFMQDKDPMQVGANAYVTNEIPLVDTYGRLHPNAEPVGTYHGFKGGPSGERIDYIFHSKGFEARYADILTDSISGGYPSDHYPLLAELIIGINNAH